MNIYRYANPKLRSRILAGEVPEWLKKHPRRERILQLIMSAPPWVDRSEIRGLAELARIKSVARGEPYVLDHIVPLSHPLVCGLTVPWNLRVVTAAENAAKGNKLYIPPVQLKLLTHPEQLALEVAT